MADAPALPELPFETSPSSYKHWKLSFDGDIATLAMDVNEDEGLGDYVLKMNSYDIGVDVERLSRVTKPSLIADRFFAPAEVAALRALPEPQQRQRFFELWTLKESYIKARGLGLAIPLHQFWFAEPDGDPVAISFGPELPDDPHAWQFRLIERGPEYATAVGVRQAGPVSYRSSATIPLLDQRR